MHGHWDHSTAFGAPRQCAADCALRNMPTNQRKHEFSNNEHYEITPHDSSFLFSGLSQLYLRVQHHSQEQILHSCCPAQCPLARHCPGHPGALDCAHKDQPPCNNILTTYTTVQKFGVKKKYEKRFIFIQQGYIKLIERDSEDIYNNKSLYLK